jgi:predicted DNA-binding transcriptional regulator YafY
MERIQVVGVPAHAVAPTIRKAVEQAWFERQPLRIRYDGASGETTRVVRIASVVLERTATLLNCDDLDKGEPRQFRLDKVLAAELV